MHSKDNFPFNYLPHKKTVFCISVSVPPFEHPCKSRWCLMGMSV